MTVETVRELWAEVVATKFRGDNLVVIGEFLRRLGDARIIRGTCPTCGGSEQIPAAHLPAGATETCPDCADAPVWVIEPAAYREAVEAVADVIAEYDTCGEKTCPGEDEPATLHIPEPFAFTQEVLAAALQALLPGARVAESVGMVRYHHVDFIKAAHFETGPDGTRQAFNEGDTIAILATREEVEDESETPDTRP